MTAKYYNKRHGVRDSESFEPDAAVRIKIDGEKRWKPATVTEKHEKPRSYMVATEEGKILRRNSKHIMSSQRTGCDVTLPSAEDRDPNTHTTPSVETKATPHIQDDPKPKDSPVVTRSGRRIIKPKKLDL